MRILRAASPAQAVRAVLTGVGRLVLAADRLRAARDGAAEAGNGELTAPQRFRSLDQTGNVRLISDDDPAPAKPGPAEPEPTEPGTAESETAEPGLAEPELAESQPAEPELAEPELAEAELPVPNYGALSLASLRARLRGLDAGQLRVLAGYERSHAARPEVLGMFERRMAKLAGMED
jgi:hypothetical protein